MNFCETLANEVNEIIRLSKLKAFTCYIDMLITLSDEKKEWFKTFDNNDTILLAKRQCGKTFALCIYALWYAIFNADKTIAISSCSKDLTKDMINTIDHIYKHYLPHFLKKHCKYKKTFKEISINSSKIIPFHCVKDKKDELQGRTLDLVICDEFAFWKKSSAEQFLKVYVPSIKSRESTRWIVASTSNGINHFFDLYTNADDMDLKRINYTMKFDLNDHVIRDLVVKYGEKFVRQEYCGDFIDTKA